MPIVTAGTTELYHEVRGDGPPLLLIMGASGDAGHFATVAEELSDEFRVITYDRRGNSRSPRPPGWNATTIEEQADDAAALLRALELAPAAIFGSSSGAIYALSLLIRHPELVQAAILHEPPMLAALEDPAQVRATIGAIVEEGMAAGGPPVALERFCRFAAGDATWQALEPDLRRRMLGNAETFFSVELPTIDSYLPDDATLAAVTSPVELVVSEQSAPFYGEIADWLAGRLGVEVSRTAGTHTPYHDHPHELARTLRSFLARVGATSALGRV